MKDRFCFILSIVTLLMVCSWPVYAEQQGNSGARRADRFLCTLRVPARICLPVL